MTSEQIRIDAQLLTGLQINAVTARTWVFDAVKYIAREFPLACPKGKAIVTTTEKDGEYAVEEELVRIEKITEEGSRRPLRSQDYYCDEIGNITFYSPGTYVIEYRYVPTLTGLNESAELPIPDRFAEYIKYYVAARIRGRIFGQGDSDAQAYDALFQSYEEDANSTMQRTNKRHRRMPPRY